MEKTERAKPAFEAKLNGVRLAVWENEKEGRRWYSASPSRRYVDTKSNEAKYNSSFSVADLVLLRELIGQALEWMAGQAVESDDE